MPTKVDSFMPSAFCFWAPRRGVFLCPERDFRYYALFRTHTYAKEEPYGQGGAGMQRGVRFGRKLAEFLEIPQDIVLDLPRLTLVGNVEVTLENHRGIIESSPERLRLALPTGELVISGEELVLVSLAQEDVVIRGRIRSLELA